MEKIPLVAIAGVTASGKSDLAVSLAKAFDGEVIGADSMQIYDRLSVGTARISEAEMQGVSHHLVGFLDPSEPFSVAQYVPLAKKWILDVHRRGKLPILCGGTGLYFSAVLDDLTYNEQASSDESVKKALEEAYEKEGGEALWQRLSEKDPKAAARIHPHNKRRLLRALELLALTGESITAQNEASRSGAESPYHACCFALDYADRNRYYARVEQRVDLMLSSGLLEEAGWLYANAPESTSAQAIAYKEIWPYLSGEASLEACRERLAIATRQYAKRQRTWLRRDGRFSFLYVDEEGGPANISEKVSKSVASSLNLCYNIRDCRQEP